jgi:hypothetical protein
VNGKGLGGGSLKEKAGSCLLEHLQMCPFPSESGLFPMATEPGGNQVARKEAPHTDRDV